MQCVANAAYKSAENFHFVLVLNEFVENSVHNEFMKQQSLMPFNQESFDYQVLETL
jgi:hypothetical protein